MDLRGFETIAPFLGHPLVLVGLVLMLAFGVHRAVLRSGRLPVLSKRAGARVVQQILRSGFAIAVLLVACGFGLRFWEISQAPEVYRIRVTVLDPGGTPVNGAELTSSVGGEWQQGLGLAVLVVPASALPADRKATIRASKGPAKAVAEVTLGEDFQPSLTMRLAIAEAPVRGLVVDGGNRAVSGVRVTVDPAGAAATTDEAGRFELVTPAGDGQWVRLRAEKAGYRAVEEMVLAGEHPVRLELEEASQK